MSDMADRGPEQSLPEIVLFDRIQTHDHTAITGLPLVALVCMLRDLGFEIP